ncbi:MAG: tRNA 2-thiouridine(34) synthase MnmA, partial [Clostridia bacterium]|nr:tRNA 2-thiouridine(34) synthase MnmA [Clostridia bacterium]
EDFLSCYKNGKTPNPCIVCNPTIKFKSLIDTADEIGAKYIATGHYARIGFENGRYYIKSAENLKKDQSYMLYRLSQEVLERTIFPLGDMFKEEVRSLFMNNDSDIASKADSQEICFIPDDDYVGFIENRLGKFPKGNFISPEGNICGEHKGIINYTVGQRKGLNIALGQPAFIREINTEKNEIYLSYKGGEYFDEVIFGDVVFMKLSEISDNEEYFAKVRYSNKTESCVVSKLSNGDFRAYFKDKVRAPAKGQSIVFYDEEGNILFGGFIK